MISLARKRWGWKKNPGTNYKAPTHHCRIRNQKKIKSWCGEWLDTVWWHVQAYCIHNIVNTRVVTLSYFYTHEKTESFDILFNFCSDYNLQSVWVTAVISLLPKALGLGQSSMMVLSEWHNFENWDCKKISIKLQALKKDYFFLLPPSSGKWQESE